MYIPTPALIFATLPALCLFGTLIWTRHRLRIVTLDLKRVTVAKDLACLDLCETVAELSRHRAHRAHIARQLADLSEDFANAQRAIVKVHGAAVITPERQAIITAASKVDQVRAPLECEVWASPTST